MQRELDPPHRTGRVQLVSGYGDCTGMSRLTRRDTSPRGWKERQ